MDLHRPERRRRVGREVGVARASGEDDDAALLEVALGAPPDVRLGDLADLDGGLHARTAIFLRSMSCIARAFMTVASMPM